MEIHVTIINYKDHEKHFAPERAVFKSYDELSFWLTTHHPNWTSIVAVFVRK